MGSLSGSLATAVALRTALVEGALLLRLTVAVGALSAMTTEVLASVLSCPSLAVTRTLIVSPRSPFPATERSSVDVVAPAIGVPFRDHSYMYVTGSPASEELKSGSEANASARSVSPVNGVDGVRVRL